MDGLPDGRLLVHRPRCSCYRELFLLGLEPLPVGCQRWRNLALSYIGPCPHWPVPAAALRRLGPRQLDLDLYAGQASVSIVPFLVAESRPRGITRVLATRFLETNLRTYVRAADGEAGIYFFSQDASSFLAVSAARLLYGLPYFPAAMSERTEEPRTEYSSRRRGARDAQLDMDEVLGAAAERARRHPRSFLDRAVQPVPPAW